MLSSLFNQDLDLWIMSPIQGLSTFVKTSKADISDKGSIVPERSGQDTGSPEGRLCAKVLQQLSGKHCTSPKDVP